MTPIQQLMLGVGASKKTYLDDVFSTYLWKGTGAANKVITNNIDLTEGGMTWIKNRELSSDHMLYDTVRGVTKYLNSNDDGSEATTSGGITSFNNNGFTVGANGESNMTNDEMSSWTFRKAPGFFDIVTYTGSGSNRTIAHSLGSVPGCIMVKCTSSAEDWAVYHRATKATHALILNTTGAATDDNYQFNDTEPTASVFSLGTDSRVNGSGKSYVCYLFAGGESTAATARSVVFDGSDDYLAFGDSSDLSPESGDFTWEAWIKPDSWTGSAWDLVYANHITNGLFIGKDDSDNFVVRSYANTSYIETSNLPTIGQWTHVAVTRSGSTLRLFYNGTLEKSVTNSYSFATGNTRAGLGVESDTYDGLISNLRFVKGTAVYTSSFRPPTEPLTNITNTKLLCCNNSSITGSTVTPGTITANGDPTASTDSPFDDPAGFAFGDAEDQNVIKCGSYVGESGANKVNLGWEPQWVMVKNVDSSEPWVIMDSMRGWVNQSSSSISLRANSTGNESAYGPWGPTSTGWELDLNSREIDMNDQNYIYIAIRRPDGYCGKPYGAGEGTSVFAMDNGSNSSTIPLFDTGFPVDFALNREPASTENWFTGARLTGRNYMFTSTNAAETAANDWVWDSNVGWAKGAWGSSYQSWMFKRHAGFDVVAYKGTGVTGYVVPHQMSKAPEMMWIKNRDDNVAWRVFHIGHGGGTNPDNYGGELNSDVVPHASDMWFEGNPTSTHIKLKTSSLVNADGKNYLAMLFASVEGVSKVGSYVGVSSNGNATIDLGFTPRLFICKRLDSTAGWYIWDSLRGLGSSGTEKPFFLNSSNAEGNAYNYLDTTSNGVTLYGGITADFLGNDPSTHKYIYYAHA